MVSGNDFVTNQMLDAKLETFENKLVARMASLEAAMERGFKNQTWKLMGAVLVAIPAAVRLANVT